MKRRGMGPSRNQPITLRPCRSLSDLAANYAAYLLPWYTLQKSMKKLLIPGGIFLISAGLAFGQNTPRALLDQYCVTCHNDCAKTGGLTLENIDPAHVAQNAETWEKVVRKLRAGMMPPQGMQRPE